MAWFAQPSTPRILISRVSAHGDVIQTLPLLAALKAWQPQCRIGWLVEASAAPLLAGHPLIDRLHTCHRKQWLRQGVNPLDWPKILADATGFIRELKEEQYDVSLDVQGLFKSALWPFLAGIPIRMGNQAARESAEWLYTNKLPPHAHNDPQRPAVSRYLEFAVALGCPIEHEAILHPRYTIPPITAAQQAKAQALLDQLPLNQLPTKWPLVALAPATLWPSKHWQETHWQTLLRQLAHLPVRVILVGSAADQPLIARLTQSLTAPNVLNLAGQTDLADLYALFQAIDVLIGPDSAPLHIANATGQPRIIALFGPTGPTRTGPIGDRHVTLYASLESSLPCQPCFQRVCPLGTDACMHQLTPTQVLRTLQTMLEKSPT